MTLVLRNPHSVLAAIQKRPSDVVDIVLPAHKGGPGAGGDDSSAAWDRVQSAARQHGIPVLQSPTSRTVERPGRPGPSSSRLPHPGRRDEGPSSSKEGRMGIAEARVKEHPSVTAEELFAGARDRGEGRGLWVALDQVQDPHNVGAIFRTAAFFGVQGILLTENRSAGLSGVVYDVASGGVEAVPFAVETNLKRSLEIAKDAGLWILGTSEHAHDSLMSIQRDRPWLLVVGNEEKGMRRLTEESCDLLCKIPQQGKLVGSLNVSVAAGIFISTLAGADR